jgi:trigger factor
MLCGDVLELADRHDLGSCAERRKGSSPFFPTRQKSNSKVRNKTLKIETQPIENHQLKVIAEFESDVMEQYKHRAAKQIAREAKIPGFRPGKAPYDVIHRLYGDDVIEKQAVELIIDDAYPKILEEANIKPGGSGSLEEVISTNPPKFSFIVPLMPEVTLPDYKSMRKDYQYEGLSTDEYDKFVNNLRKSTATAEPVERPAEKGDLLYLLINGKLPEAAEGEDGSLVNDRSFQVVIGDDESEESWPFPGFSNELTGLSQDAEKTIIYSYPEDSLYDKLRGKEVEFTVKIQSIKKMVLPELDDEFAKLMGYESLEKLQTTIRERLENNKKEEFDQDYAEELVDQIVKEATIKYPPNVLEEETHSILHSLEHDLADQHMDFETYLKVRNLEKDAFMADEIKPAAVKRLERSLVVEKIATEEKIELDQEQLKAEVTQALGQLVSNPSFKKPKNNAEYKQIIDAVSYDTANRLFNKQIMQKLVEIGSGKVSAAPVEEKVEDQAEKPAAEEVEVAPKPKKSRSKKQEA